MKISWAESFAATIHAAQTPTPELEAYLARGNAQRAADQLRNPQLCTEKIMLYETELIFRKLREEYRNGLTNS